MQATKMLEKNKIKTCFADECSLLHSSPHRRHNQQQDNGGRTAPQIKFWVSPLLDVMSKSTVCNDQSGQRPSIRSKSHICCTTSDTIRSQDTQRTEKTPPVCANSSPLSLQPSSWHFKDLPHHISWENLYQLSSS